MGPIVRAQLRENAPDVALDGSFPNRQLVGDLLIAAASSNQTKHVNFARAQLIVRSMLSQLRRNFGRDPGVARRNERWAHQSRQREASTQEDLEAGEGSPVRGLLNPAHVPHPAWRERL